MMFKLILTSVASAAALNLGPAKAKSAMAPASDDDRPKMDLSGLASTKAALKADEGTVEKNRLPNKDDIAAEKGEKIEYGAPDDARKEEMNAALAGLSS